MNANKDQYEIEIKSLLGEKANADKLRTDLKQALPGIKLMHQSKQLNHYFIPGDFSCLQQKIETLIPDDKKATFDTIVKHGKKHSIRSRDTEGVVLLVVKASIDDTSSSNGISRMEWESPVGKLSMNELDQVLLACGFTYQAKWSREREEYVAEDMHVCIDKNAGYGYLAEFEKVVDDPSHANATKEKLLAFMESLGVKELPQDRLERMFAHYNQHWGEYYGTDNTFVIE